MSNSMPVVLTLQDFANSNGKEWNAIFKAQQETQNVIEKIKKAVSVDSTNLSSSDADLILFGSVARRECTGLSDIDWTILVDGQASSSHHKTAFVIKKSLSSAKLIEPGSSGMFGQTTFSHDIINFIGGQDDTNHNMTRRLLLLLESINISFAEDQADSATAYGRVCRAIIAQYFEHDSSFLPNRPIGKTPFPRYLLNDMIRFWRTMCVDFAYKQKEQGGDKWALRNIKLRMSRRLIFMKGLLMCYECYREQGDVMATKESLNRMIGISPLDFVLDVLQRNGANSKDIIEIFESYNEFLVMLDNSDVRDELKNLDMYKAYENEKFLSARKNCDRFQKAVNNVFASNEGPIQEFILRYCIF